MLRIDKVIKPWKDAAALNDHINLYGQWNETSFLTVIWEWCFGSAVSITKAWTAEPRNMR
jgi:hypothetical protein